MNKQKLSKETEIEQCTIPFVSKRKYWYKTNIYGCVLCGKEKVGRERVYDEQQKGTNWHDDACGEHF